MNLTNKICTFAALFGVCCAIIAGAKRFFLLLE